MEWFESTLGYLYLEFLEFLKRRVCVETLLCHRMITIFEEAMAKKDYPIGNELGKSILWNDRCKRYI